MAFLAIMLSSLMPTVSHAIQAHRASEAVLHEVCTAEGLRTVSVAHGDAGDHAPAQHQDHGQDCQYCRLQSDSPTLPAPFHATPLPRVDAPSRPRLFYAAPERLFAWVSANPRGPPRFS
ncbi:MAG TPA: DUF2946 domain-containing protein [Noviherbaspirillum sp.]|uniref:DUF2946 domain-containing protein n=1 Tax=Noviherbaspirillum sp. TaxID=1926288 RepID=UPI002F9520B1